MEQEGRDDRPGDQPGPTPPTASAGEVPPTPSQPVDHDGPVGPGDPGDPTDGIEAAQAAAQQAAEAATQPGMRGPLSLISLGIVLFLAALGLWWVQDVVGTVVNEGEADIGREVAFTSDGGAYRLLSSGPLRPEVASTWCDITTSDGRTRREVGGQGLQTSRLGVDRLLTIHPPAGSTTIRCTSRGTDIVGNGRFQVIEADGLTTWIPAGVFVAAMASIAIGAGLAWRAVARARRQN